MMQIVGMGEVEPAEQATSPWVYCWSRPWLMVLRDIGVKYASSGYLRDKIRLCNQVSCFVVLLGLIYWIISLILFPHVAGYPLAVASLGGVCLVGTALGYQRLARFVMGTGICIVVAGYHAALVGAGEPILEPVFIGVIAFALYPWVLMDLREKRLLYPSLAICFATILSQRFLDRWIEVEVDVSAFRDGPLLWISYFFACLVCFSCMYFAQQRALAAERERDELLAATMVDRDEEQFSRVRAEERSVELEALLLQAQRLEAIGRIAGGVAHDLNNLLTPVMGNAFLLRENIGRGEREQCLEEILDAANKASDLVRRLLVFSKKQRLELRRANLNDVTRDFSRLLRKAVREDIAIELDLEDGLPVVSVDLRQVEQVLMNLVVNARDAIPEQGTITISTRRVILDERYCLVHPNTRPGEYVAMTVADDGVGMDAETKGKVFDPFFSTKDEKGTGLGLSTVYGVASLHGGHVVVDSELGRGTSLQVFFPVVEGVETDIPLPPLARELPLGMGETVLLAEDEELVRRYVEKALRRLGYEVLVAADGRSALELAARPETKFDVLVTDVVMPRLNGPQLARGVRALHPTIGVVFMSGYPNDVVERHDELAVGTIIQKPFSAAVLASAVRESINPPAEEQN